MNDFDTSIIPHTDVVAIGAEVRRLQVFRNSQRMLPNVLVFFEHALLKSSPPAAISSAARWQSRSLSAVMYIGNACCT